MNKYKRLLSHTTILGVGTFGSKLLVFFLVRFYTECLSAEEYGTADLITQTANFLIPLLSLGVADAVFRFAMDSGEDKRSLFSSALLLLSCSGLVFSLFLPLFFLGEDFRYVPLILLYAFLSCIHSLFAQYIRGLGQVKLFALQGLIGTAVTILCNLLFLLVFQMGVVGYVLSVVAADALTTVLLFFAAHMGQWIRFRSVSRDTVRRMLRYSIPLIPTTVFWWITNVSDRYMLRWMIGAEINGLYAVAYKIPTILILLSGVFCEAWQFSAVRDKEEDAAGHNAFFGKIFDSFQAVMFLAGGVLIAASRLAIRILAAPEYAEAWRYIPLLILATVFSSLVTFLGVTYLTEKKSSLSFYTSMLGAGLNILLNFLLIPRWGGNGAGIATFFAYFAVFWVRLHHTRKYTPFPFHRTVFFANLLVTVLQTACMIAEVPYDLLWQIGCLLALLGINAPYLAQSVKKILRRSS